MIVVTETANTEIMTIAMALAAANGGNGITTNMYMQ